MPFQEYDEKHTGWSDTHENQQMLIVPSYDDFSEYADFLAGDAKERALRTISEYIPSYDEFIDYAVGRAREIVSGHLPTREQFFEYAGEQAFNAGNSLRESLPSYEDFVSEAKRHARELIRGNTPNYDDFVGYVKSHLQNISGGRQIPTREDFSQYISEITESATEAISDNINIVKGRASQAIADKAGELSDSFSGVISGNPQRLGGGKLVRGDLKTQDKIDIHDQVQSDAMENMDAVIADYDQMLESFGHKPTGHLSNAERREMMERRYVPNIEKVNEGIEETEGVLMIQQAHANAVREKNKLYAIY